MIENLDPKFKFHMIYSLLWLIGGIIMVHFLIGDSSGCDLEANSQCPILLEELRYKAFVGWGLMVSVMIILRIVAHQIKVSQQPNRSVKG